MKKIHPTSMLALACVLGVGVMLSGLACGVLWPWPGQECLTDADCPDGYTCQNGVCVETPAPECTTDADCPDGYT
ncbi:MAG: hypothetical protein KAV82_10925, partial [Phycisphaerae bacterium]|nr:hypothetical protein [Phycisphaerae bacterium]